MKNTITSFLAIGLIFGAANANAIEFDFQRLTDITGTSPYNGSFSGTLANGNLFSGSPGEAAYQSFTWTIDGLSVSASATHSTGKAAYAYLDQGNAGLGVCSSGLKTDRKGPNQCDPGNDDNVTINEILNLTFSQKVLINIADATFRDGGHGLYNYPAPSLQYSVDGGGWLNFGTNMNVESKLQGTSFEFRTESDSNQFYIDTFVASVPEPTTTTMLGLGLLLLAGNVRRKLKSN